MTDIGHYDYLVAQRDSVLASARMSAAARARALGQRHYAPIVTTATAAVVQPAPIVARLATTRIRIHCATRVRGATSRHAGPTPDHRGRMSDIIAATADAFGVSVDDLLSPSRYRRVAYPRFAAKHIMFKVLRVSLASMGKVFGRDHTTCLTGVRRAAQLRRSDPAFAGRSRLVARELRRKWGVQ